MTGPAASNGREARYLGRFGAPLGGELGANVPALYQLVAEDRATQAAALERGVPIDARLSVQVT